MPLGDDHLALLIFENGRYLGRDGSRSNFSRPGSSEEVFSSTGRQFKWKEEAEFQVFIKILLISLHVIFCYFLFGCRYFYIVFPNLDYSKILTQDRVKKFIVKFQLNSTVGLKIIFNSVKYVGK
jgi:hypothetical protein